MKNKLIVTLLAVLLISCSQNNKRSFNDASKMEADQKSGTFKADSSSKDYISSTAAKEKGKDSNRKFIRTAELKFQVKDVIRSTYTIEDIVAKHDGYVSYTNLQSSIDNKVVTPVSEDSSVESTYYNVSNTMIMRVPNTKLDSTLKSMASLVDYLDYRIIKADDVGLQILANNLSRKRNNVLQQRMDKAIEKHGKKLTETTNAEENAMSRQEISDNALLTNLAIADQIKYSTVNLTLYQRQEVRKLLIANEKNIRAFEPSLGHKMAAAFRTGWELFEEILLFFTRIWGLILIGLVIVILYRRYNRRNRIVEEKETLS
jgi:hypothetical protein